MTVVGQSGSPKVNDIKTNDTVNFLIISLSEELKENENYTLTIPFYGNLVRGLDGAYISTYTDNISNKTKWVFVNK